jgi:DNA-binding HxlR family transcriptional regulator
MRGVPVTRKGSWFPSDTMQLVPALNAPPDAYLAHCPCRSVLDLLADKWSALALGALVDGPLRFGEVRRRLEGISPKVLTAVLRRLAEHGLVERTVYPAVPLHVEYALTELGRDVNAPLDALRRWVEANIERFP